MINGSQNGLRAPLFSILAALLLAAVGLAGGAGDKVLTLSGYQGPHQLPQDQGAAGVWQSLLKLRTTASAIHTTAHPDDEHGGVLTYLGRGLGSRTAMMTINRGEGGANAIGPELFDGLGIIRTEELLLSDRYYGLDDQYFSVFADYGYSKTLDEALEKWGKENVMRDFVRVLRINRPLVIVSRFHNSPRDGHGNHQTAGLASYEVFDMAGDPSVFPEQIEQEGLRPWQPLKMYRGGIRAAEGENWHVRVDAGRYAPHIGQSYRWFASLGLSFQRSQTSGRMREIVGPFYQYYERMHSRIGGLDKEAGFFDGIDTSLSGIYNLTGETPPEGVNLVLERLKRGVEQAFGAYNVSDPSAVTPALVNGLKLVREALALAGGTPEAAFLLKIKERQFQDAINTALGLHLRAAARPIDAVESPSPWAAPPTMGPVVPGQQFAVKVDFANRGSLPIHPRSIRIEAGEGWRVENRDANPTVLGENDVLSHQLTVTVPERPVYSRPYFFRESIQESVYQLKDEKYNHMPYRSPAAVAVAEYDVLGQAVSIRETVRALEANLPYGHEWRELAVLPNVAVNVTPEIRVVPLQRASEPVEVQIELINNDIKGSQGELKLVLPSGWRSTPESISFSFAQAGERSNHTFALTLPTLERRAYRIEAVATVGGREFRDGYQIIRHRDYETRYLFRSATADVRGIDAQIAPDLSVGYIMGVGDQVPSGTEQLGAEVTLLGQAELAGGDLSRFDAIVIGTRAYAVREDLITYNSRLLEFARNGGNLIVLYQTPEFDPNRWAAYPAELPQRSEEVSEEDSPVRILAPNHPVFTQPNRITLADFDDWVEQRGSKFFSEWSDEYVPLLETYDQGQPPQHGGCLTAEYGEGYYSYCAYAFHRQLPYGVEGAYRWYANFLSLGK
jgi:LmbE family N-acetylglucosaminyl deacetylase